MKVRAAARILEKGVQDDLIDKAEETRERIGGRSWKDHGLTWAAVKGPHYNTCLEEILAAMGENGERRIEWDFTRERKQLHTLYKGDLGTKDTLQVVWEMRIRDLEEEGWTTAFTDGSGLNHKAAGGFCSNPNRTDKERQPETSGSKYLGTKSTHFDGELEGIALALEQHTHTGTNLLAILTDSKPAIRVLEKLDSGTEAPRSAIEARIHQVLGTLENNRQDTYIAWVKGHKDIKGNEKADKLSKETSILGHESEGVVTPAGLRAWARRVRAEARGGIGEGILGWHRRAISAYTWCVTEKGPQNKWLHKLKKSDTPACRCQQQEEQSGEHLAARCSLLTRARSQVERKELLEWKSRHARNKMEKKEKGPVEPGKEEEEDKLETFFCQLYEFHNPPVSVPDFIPAELPPRYAINFVPASHAAERSAVSPASVVSNNVSATPPVAPNNVSDDAADFSVVSSVNFIPASFFTSSPCIGTTQ